jgi:uncharacterized protein
MSDLDTAPPMPMAPDRRRRDLVLFLAGTFGLTWGLAAVAIAAPDAIRAVTGSAFSTTNPAYFLAVYAPSVIAVVLTATQAGRSGLRELAGRVFRWRVHPAYYALVLLGLPALDVLARLVQASVLGDPLTSSGEPLWTLLLGGVAPTPMGLWYAAPLFLLATLVLDAGPIGEEIGWKGYALPRMIGGARGPLAGALVFGVIWGVWHAPAFLISGTAQYDMGLNFAVLVAGSICLSLIMTWLYRRTHGSILVSGILVHLFTNSMVSRLSAFVIVLAVPAIACAVALRRGRRSALHRAVPA